MKRLVVLVCGERGALPWLDGSQKPVNKTSKWLSCESREPFKVLFMDKKELLLKCVQSYTELISVRYHFVLGKAGKIREFDLTFDKSDCYHLMGLHYLADRKDRRGRNIIFDNLVNSEIIRKYYATSQYWTDEITDRIVCTSNLKEILENDNCVFRYNPKKLEFYSRIRAEYLVDYEPIVKNDQTLSLYLFIDKRDSSEERYCKSVFTKSDKDYSERQEKWTVLYKDKEDLLSGTKSVIYQKESYSR